MAFSQLFLGDVINFSPLFILLFIPLFLIFFFFFLSFFGLSLSSIHWHSDKPGKHN